LSLSQIPFERQASLPVVYKGNRLNCGYRVDIIVDKKVILELDEWAVSGGTTNTQSPVANIFEAVRIKSWVYWLNFNAC